MSRCPREACPEDTCGMKHMLVGTFIWLLIDQSGLNSSEQAQHSASSGVDDIGGTWSLGCTSWHDSVSTSFIFMH